jgi:hypothetical protein
MDGQKIHDEYISSKTPSERARVHRLNVDLGTPEPALHDVGAMKKLEALTLDYIGDPNVLANVKRVLFASMFCFELDSLPTRERNGINNGLWKCSGHVFCRLALPAAGRRRLIEELSTSYNFLLSEVCSQATDKERLDSRIELGAPRPCVGKEVNAAVQYRRWLSFHVGSLDNYISIKLAKRSRGATDTLLRPCNISGMPKRVNSLIEAQGLISPFGRLDHQVSKSLPRTPRKRKFSEIEMIEL